MDHNSESQKNLKILYNRRRASTLPELFKRAVTRYGSLAAFPDEGITYGELGDRVFSFSRRLRQKGSGRHIAIIGENSPSWITAFFSIVCSGNVAVPLDKGLPKEEIASTLKRGRCSGIIYEARYSQIMSELEEEGSSPVREWICMEDIESYFVSRPQQTAQISSAAAENTDPDSLAVLLFTSGTTSMSKAVMLTHENLCENVFSYTSCTRMTPDDTVLAVLPFHHTFGMMAAMISVISCGAKSVFSQGLKDVTKVIRDSQVTIFMSVPLLVEKLADKADSILGGKLHTIVCGASPLSPDTTRFFEKNGILTAQVYGLTETSPALCIETEKEHRAGSVGKPVPNVTVAIDSPDSRGIGEIKAKGPNVMKGYYNDDIATAKVMKNGWFHTGDLGCFDEDGFLYIKGRIKNVIVLKSGKNVFPEELEAVFEKLPYVRECMISGVPRRGKDKTDPVLMLHLVLDPELADCNDPDTKLRIQKDVDDISSRLPKYKRPVKLSITDRPLERTSTQKIKRSGKIETVI